jgi:hypothetical protein
VHLPRLGRAATGDPTSVGLFELVAVFGIIQGVGEIREQVQSVLRDKNGRSRQGVRRGVLIVSREVIAIGSSAIRRIDVAEARDASIGNRPTGNLIGRMPGAAVG